MLKFVHGVWRGDCHQEHFSGGQEGVWQTACRLDNFGLDAVALCVRSRTLENFVGSPVPQILEETVEMTKLLPQERVQTANRGTGASASCSGASAPNSG